MGRVLLVVQVDVGDGRAGKVEVRAGGPSAKDLAGMFCMEHGLPEEQVDLLAEEITAQCEKLGISTSKGDKEDKQGSKKAFIREPGGQGEEERKKDAYMALQKRYEAGGAAQVAVKRERPPWQSTRSKASAGDQTRSAGDRIRTAVAAGSSSSTSEEQRRVLSKKAVKDMCDRLHQQSIAARSEAERLREWEKNHLLAKELEQCTFQPQISRHAKEAPGGRTRGAGLDREVDRYRESLRLREELLKEQERIELEKNCSFKPTISERSEQQAKAQAKNIQRGKKELTLHEQLYQQAQERRNKITETERAPQYSFKPQLNVNDPILAKLREEPDDNFVERLAMPKAPPEPPTVDLSTGRPLFKPEVGRPPDARHARPANVPISEFLFMSRHQYSDVRERLRQEHILEEEKRLKGGDLAKRVINPLSARIAGSIKETRFAQLWEALREQQEASQEEHAPALAGETEVHKLRCLVELLPEILLRHVGPDAVLSAADSMEKSHFVQFMVAQSRGLPCHTDILLS